MCQQMSIWYPDGRKCKSFDKRSKRAEICTQQRRQHVDSLVDEIDCCASRCSFTVHWVVWMDEMRDIGDVYIEHGEDLEWVGK